MTETLTPKGVQPAPRGPRLPVIPGPVDTAVLAWRGLRRMSTALLLLFALTAASVVATFVPQRPNVPTTVTDWIDGVEGPGVAFSRALDGLSLFDVFGSWWFALLTILLFTSLTGCLVPRFRAFARTARRPPDQGRNLERLSHHEDFTTELPAAEVLARAERLLRRRRFRRRMVALPDGSSRLAADRGHWREGGSLVFHGAFYLLLVGVLVGAFFGFRGHVDLFEGASYADARFNYLLADPGPLFGFDDHPGFTVRLDDFDVSYFENLTPRDFVSTVTVFEDGAPVRTEQIRVNHPLVHDGMKLYQSRYGLAPEVRVWLGDELRFAGPVRLAQNGVFWQGSEKILIGDQVAGDPQIALDFTLVANAETGADGTPVVSPDLTPDNPVLLAELYVGDLGLERATDVRTFDRTRGALDAGMLREGATAELAEGTVRIEYAGTGYWSGFQVTHAPGRWLLLLAGILILVGLIPSLYSFRRRVWVAARPAADGATVVTVAGVALQRKPAFAEEFAALARDLRAAVPDVPKGK